MPAIFSMQAFGYLAGSLGSYNSFPPSLIQEESEEALI
jgi:hypothetical protein